jgi:hypothetical protein
MLVAGVYVCVCVCVCTWWVVRRSALYVAISQVMAQPADKYNVDFSGVRPLRLCACLRAGHTGGEGSEACGLAR